MSGHSRTDRIEPFRVMALLARAKELEASGRDIVHMEVGEPDFTTPQTIIDAGQKYLATGQIHYTSACGLPALREKIAQHYRQQYGISISAQRIVITPGASGALLLALGALLEAGQSLMLADPGYPCNRNFAWFLNAEVQSVPVDASTAYQLNANLIEQHWRAESKAVLLASPSNPTGTIIEADELRRIVQTVKAGSGHVIVDEIYHGLVYDTEVPTALSIDDDVFVINSFSKYFGMTGWRLGWMVVPEHYVDVIDRLAQNLFLAASTPAQHAALVAFEDNTRAILEQRRQAYQQRRDFLLPALRDIGFDIPLTPQGAFYLYANASRFTDNSEAFCSELLEKIGVAITPGTDFGKYKASQHVRFAYTTSMTKLEEGIKRLKNFL